MAYIVDDDPGVTRALEIFFSTLGISCRIFQTIAACLDFFQTQRGVCSPRPFDPVYDIFILDFVLPTMNGYHAAKSLEDYFKTRGLNVILISGQTKESLEAKLNEKLPYDFLQKPFTLKQLEDVLSKFKGQSHRLPAQGKHNSCENLT
ncbi:response regulator [Aequoribacter sp.]|uniref:response regulator n=1 Tax=Aequoribacter sp. TaxID=2847771 RepID=UPI003F69C75B